MTRIAIHQDDVIESAVTAALDQLEVEPLVHGKTVAVKPNDTWASAKDRTAVTQPDTLRAVLRYIKRFGPKHIIVTGGSGAGETDRIFEVAELMDVVREEETEFYDHNRAPLTEVELAYAPGQDVDGPQKSVFVSSRVLTYETLVSVAQLKVHETATVTLGLKNIAMSFPAADHYGHSRGSTVNLHHFFEDLHSFIAAMAKRFPPDLSVVVGHPAMVGTGPIGGHTVETGLVIAGTDPLAVDVVGARMLGFDIQAVRHLWEAHRLGVGEGAFSNMEFSGLSLERAVAVFTERIYGRGVSLTHP